MEPVTRRSFLVAGSAGALGVAGAAAVGAPLMGAGEPDPEPAAADLAGIEGAAMLSIRDASSGEVELLWSDRSVTFSDKRLVARLVRATR